MSRDATALLLLFCGVALLFARSGRNEFVNYDDRLYVGDPHVRQGLTADTIGWAFTTTATGNWHPLAWLSHMLDVELFGLNPAGHHLVGVILHALNTTLLYLVLRGATGRSWPAFFAAALWAAHPLRVESVAWAAERKDLLCATFFLLSVFAYVRYALRRSPAWYACAVAMFALSLMSKPMSVTLPFLLLLLDAWPLGREAGWKSLLREKIPFFALSLASCIVTFVVQRQGGAMGEDIYPPGLRIANAFSAFGRYLVLTIWPARLSVFYPYEGALPGTNVSIVALIAGVLLLLAVTMLLWWIGRRAGGEARAPLVGWLWWCGMLVPVIGLVQVGSQSMADRYSYLPQMGLAISVVWLILGAASGRPKLRPAAAVVGGVLLVALAARTFVQIGYWKDSETLFSHALAVTRHNHLAHNKLAQEYSERDDLRRAIEHTRAAIVIKPGEAPPHYNLGVFEFIRGNFEAARVSYERALAINADYPDALINLAQVLERQGEPAAAAHRLRRAIDVARSHGDTATADKARRMLDALPSARPAAGTSIPTTNPDNSATTTATIRASTQSIPTPQP